MDLQAVEKAIGQRLPEDMRNFLLETAGKIIFDWGFNEEVPAESPVEWGSIYFDLSQIPEWEDGRQSWASNVFPDINDEYDAVWHDKIAFQHVVNGDLIALDSQGQVVYLSHEDGDGHGVVLASTFTKFMTEWLRLGCPGPEDDDLLAFQSSPGGPIDSRSGAGTAWRALLGRE
ncbi:unnamed protein product, partial [Discosporangium mesarthrocarpum]